MADLVGLVRECWGDHPDLEQDGYDALLCQYLDKCVKLAGSINNCGQVILAAASDEKIKKRVADSKHLGAYIKKCMSGTFDVPGWLTRFESKFKRTTE